MKIIQLTLILTLYNFMLCQAQVPGTLSYQGILMQSDGITPISDGAHSIVFNFYNASAGGSVLFSRTISVTTTKGLYTCIIGSGTAPNAPFNATEMNQIGSQQVFIAITVDGGSELSPRAQLTPGAYSFRSESISQVANPTGGNVSFWGTNNTLSSDANLFWDNTNKLLGLGTTTPAAPLDIKGSNGNFRAFDYVLQFTRPAINYFHATSVGGQFYFTVNGNTNTDASMMIKANGNVGINTTNPLEKLHVVGNICYSGSSNQCSDIRFKKNLESIGNPLAILRAINGKYFYWRSDEFSDYDFKKTRDIGFIAQEIKQVIPEMVITDKDGYLYVDYEKITPVLVESIKEQQTQIEELKSKNRNLEQRLLEIEALLSKNSVSGSLSTTKSDKP